MEMSDVYELRKRGQQLTRKRDYLRRLKSETTWSDHKVRAVLKHRHDLIMLQRGLRRRSGHPASSHQQHIATSMLLDGWLDDYLMHALAWSHDKKDDHGHRFSYLFNSRNYSPVMAVEINRMSRLPEWCELPFEDEVEFIDASIRSGKERTMVTKVLDREHNLLYPLRVKSRSERRRRKSGMKVWQTLNSIRYIAADLGYKEDEILWLGERERKRLGFTPRELDNLVLQPLNNP